MSTQTETALYEEMWAHPEYGQHSPGEQMVDLFLEIVTTQHAFRRGLTVLDAGCGSGKGAVALKARGFDVRLCDLTNAGLLPEASRLPFYVSSLTHDLSLVVRDFGFPGRRRADFVYCCDVLEHVPTQFTMLAIDQMLRASTKGLFLNISLVPDRFGMWVGEQLHKTVQPFKWWRDSIGDIGTVVDARDMHGSATFYVRPRC